MIESVDHVEEIVQTAIKEATTGRPGPVWIHIPIDLQGKQMPVFSLEDADQEVAERPLILAGGGISCAGISREEFREYVKEAKIPVVATYNSVDLGESDDPYFVGRVAVKGTRAGNFANPES